MMDKLPADKKWQNAIFIAALKAGVAAGELLQTKNSYKILGSFKKKVVAAEKKAEVTKKMAEAP
jgi:hypothetical protein